MSNAHGIDDATALVCMPELVVRAQVLRDGEWCLAIETRPGPRWCPGCGVRAVGHGRSRTMVRDLPIAGVPTVLVFARRRLRCPESLCEVRTWSEHIEQIAPRASLTERARERLATMVNIDGFSIAAAAVEFGVGWHTANTAVAEYTDPAVDDPARLGGVRGLSGGARAPPERSHATLVVDHFHAIKLANAAIDDVRRTVQNDTLGHRGRKGDPLYRGRRVFLTGIDRLSDHRIAWVFDMLAAGDPYGEVGAAILAKDLLREVYAARDLAHARRRLILFFQHCADADVAELTRLARTIERWQTEVLAYHHTGRASNGRVENVHILAEKIRRNAHGFTNHHHYRRRLIGRLDIKWTAVATRRIRGRQPRSVA